MQSGIIIMKEMVISSPSIGSDVSNCTFFMKMLIVWLLYKNVSFSSFI